MSTGGVDMNLAELAAEAEKQLNATINANLAQGGQKAVLKATTAAGDDAAMKVIKLEGAHAVVARERAKREVDVLANINSPYVVSVLSSLVELGSPVEGVAWLEEFIEGDDLRSLVSSQWSWADAREMARCVASGLEAFHAAKVVHRDLSLANVMRLSNGTYKVIDPGLGRHLTQTTLTGTFQPGTPGFMSPEHVTPGVRVLPASDIFSLGVLLYLCLTGDVPIAYAGDFDDYAKRLRKAQLSATLKDQRSGLPDEAYTIVGRCLQRQSARRYVDGAELAAALRTK